MSLMVHELFERFLAQAPFGVLIVEARGVTVFANRALHELFGIAGRADRLLDIDLASSEGFAGHDFRGVLERARAGDVSENLLPRADGRTFKVLSYPLRDATGATEHVVLRFDDATEALEQHQRLLDRIGAVSPRQDARERRARITSLAREELKLVNRLRMLGVDPE